jgi:hypothetical protein
MPENNDIPGRTEGKLNRLSMQKHQLPNIPGRKQQNKVDLCGGI